MPDLQAYIWVVDAAKEYRRSRAWLDQQVQAGRLTYARFEGNVRIYLRRDELDALLGKPIIEERRQDSSTSPGAEHI